MEFANKLLAFNPAKNLTSFKEVIYRICSIKKYTLNISYAYLKIISTTGKIKTV